MSLTFLFQSSISFVPPVLLDFSKYPQSKAIVKIRNDQHRFAQDAKESGTDSKMNPIFGSLGYLVRQNNDSKTSKSNKNAGHHNRKQEIIHSTKSNLSFGMPFFRFKRGHAPKITFKNDTCFTTNLHWHGLNTTADVDGGATAVEFGPGAELGTELVLDIPAITNNSGIFFYHSHAMFSEINFIYTGIAGAFDVVDYASRKMQRWFQYGNNQLMLVYQDLDLTAEGTQTSTNTAAGAGGARSCFGMINGHSCINWYTDSTSTSVPFVQPLHHHSSRNLMKIDITNATTSFRAIFVGVCDENQKIQDFYLIQSDAGLCNPSKIQMIQLSPANRVSMMIDLRDFPHDTAYLFMYNFDLTELGGAFLTHPSNPNDPALSSPVPDLTQTNNPTPSATPIPGPNTALNYPVIPAIPMITELLENGSIVPPQRSGQPFTIKPFLRIQLKPKCSEKNKVGNDNEEDISSSSTSWSFLNPILRAFQRSSDNQPGQCPPTLHNVIKYIRKVVFGAENYAQYKKLINTSQFEYDAKGVNYLSLLNPHYFYNLPDFGPSVPYRNIVLFFDNKDNSNVPGGNPNGTTEFVQGQARAMADLWNSDELDLQYAIGQYNLNPNNYKPSVLPTLLFDIVPTIPHSSMGYQMLVNDTLTVQLFSNPIAYGDTTTLPLASVTIVFPPNDPSKPLNIAKWTHLVNTTFSNTTVIIAGNPVTLSTILSLDWTFFPYTIRYLNQRAEYLKSVLMKVLNQSRYFVRLLGPWILLQFFGKSMGTQMIMPMGMSNNNQCGCCDGCQCIDCRCGSTGQKCSQNCKCSDNNDQKTTTCCKKKKRHQEKDERHHHKPKNSCCGCKGSPGCTCGSGCKCTTQNKCHPDCDCNGKMSSSMMSMDQNANIQQIYPAYATNDPKVTIVLPMTSSNAELIISPNTTFLGNGIDGFQSDNLMNFAVKLNSTEQWIYHNLDSFDQHDLHWHLTSGFVNTHDQENSPGLVSAKRNFVPNLYSMDVLPIGPQQSIAFNTKFLNYDSTRAARSPGVKGLGFFSHCHILMHVSQSGMMEQWFVYKRREDLF